MKITTRLRIGYILSAVIVILAGVIIYVSFTQMRIKSRELEFVDAISQNVFELSILSNEYLLYREERPRIQWDIKYKVVRRLLGDGKIHASSNQSVLTEMRKDLGLIGSHFSDLVSLHATSIAIFESKLHQQNQNRLQSLMLLKLERVLSNSVHLKNQIKDELIYIQQYTNWMFIALITATALLSVIIGLMVGRSITSPIKTLIRGAESVGSGNLEVRLETTDRNDEIGYLSKSFDQMVNNLKTVMVSRDELERAVKERTAELAISKEKLQDTLEFEKLVADLSSEFINLEVDDLNSKIEEALSHIGTYLKVDRSYLFRFNMEKTEFSISHLWEADGIQKDQFVRGVIVNDHFPWLAENLIAGRDVIIPDVEDFVIEEAQLEYDYCLKMNIQSGLILPVLVANAPLCAIGLDSIGTKREWPFEIRDRLRLIGGILANTIERIHSAERLKDTELKYRTVADYTYDWEYWENAQGRIEYVSPSCGRISGYSAEEFIKNPSLFQDIILPEDRKIWDEHRCHIPKEMKSTEIQFRIERPDGKIRWIEHACQPVLDRQGNSQGIRASNRDITKRALYRGEKQKLQSELAHINRIVTIGALTSALAHEINQPLAAMRSYAQAALRLLDADQPDYDIIRKALQGIVSDNKRAAEVVNRLRALVKKETALWEPFQINKLINDVADLMNSELVLRKTTIALNLQTDEPATIGDPIQIQQVMINLLTNALDAMDDQPYEARAITVSSNREEGGGIVVSISDSGSGIPADMMKTIFDPFHTTKQEGIGLGLPICKAIIEAHGGKIAADNNHDGGATFSFTLPASVQIK